MKEERPVKGENKERKLLIGFVWPNNCAAELKLVVIALLLLCSLATIFQFLPLSSSSSALRACISSTTTAVSIAANSTALEPPPSRPSPFQQVDEQLESGTVKRSFNPIGAAAYSFILMSAYRGGAATFAVNGLASKPLHVYGRPTYTCEYQTDDETATVPGRAILPDWGYGRVYTTVVINCTFPTAAGASTDGGRLLIHATNNGGFDSQLNITHTIEALVEPPESWNLSQFVSPPKYDYLYCGSPLYGNLSPQRVREWMAFHVRLFGKRSHFVIYDAGGVHPEVMEVLKPWMELGFVSLHDIREQERFDGYYHNQFLVVNDCLHRYRFETKWMFFFDTDEFIYVAPKHSIGSVVDLYANYTQIMISQTPISNKLCLAKDARTAAKKWGFEKLVYRDIKQVSRRNRKYAIQPRNVFATGVHLSKNLVGESTTRTDRVIRYYHYHGTISGRREPCQQFVNETLVTLDDTPYVLDTTIRSLTPFVRNFELSTIGTRLERTRQ